MPRTYIALSLLLLASLSGFGQRQGDVWFFGDRVFMDFATGVPVLSTNTNVTTIEASSSLSDENGNLLYYGTGWKLFDRSHQTVLNWPSVLEYASTEYFVQGTLLLPINDSMVYSFSRGTGGTTGFGSRAYLATINNHGNNGLGAVTSSHVLFGDSLTEHLAAIRDASNEGWWVLSHITRSDRFVRFHIDSNGTFTKSYQTIGGIHPPLWVYYIGQMVFNPQGDRMAVASDRGLLEYYSFDRCTGDLALLNTIQKPAVDSNGFSGVSFSPSGKLLYTSDGYWGFNWPSEGSRLYQYELDSANILATEKLIFRPWNCDSCRRTFGHHKLGPDGKIYLTQAIDDFYFSAQDTLWIIQNPDSIGVACNFDANGMLVRPGKTRYGLPNIPNYRIRPLVDQVAACGPDILLCKNDSVRLGVPDTSSTLTFLWWPSTGLSDPSAAQPWASPTSTTTYHLMVVDTTVQSSCDNTIDSVTVTIVSPLLSPPVAFAGNDTVVCAGLPLQLGMADTSGGAWAFAWSPSGGLNDPFVSNPPASLNASQQYILTAYRPEVVGSCQTDRDTVAVTVYDPSVLPQNPAGPDRVICIGDTIELGVASASCEFDWTGPYLNDAASATPLAWPLVTTTYFLVVQDSFFAGACATLRDTVNVTVENQNLQNLPNLQDVSFCVGECFFVGDLAVEGLVYAWSPVEGLADANASMTRAQPAGSMVYTLTVVDPSLQSLHCRERRFVVHATADACNSPSFIAVNGDGIAEVLDFGEHAGRVYLRVFDMAGRLVYGDDDYQNEWNAAFLAHGLYVYRVEVDGDCPFSFVGKIAVLH